MRKVLIGSIIAISLAIWYAKSIKSVPGIVVTTKNGEIQGIISKSRDGREFYEWLGIPYAEPPVGELRFASPKPATTWTGVKDGSKYGAVCAQVGAIGSFVRLTGSEDCLYLNIHAPKLEGNKLLPVMVWIHGGAFMTGESNMYRPDYFMDQDAVLVTINYRLGPFGFLSTADGAIRGNMGLKDQAMALKWVRDNIKPFGGDPKKVTIFGESAGGASVHFLALSPKTIGLFNKVIAQSGVAGAHWAISYPEDGDKLTKRFAKAVGCDSEESPQILKCLMAKTTNELLEGSVYDIANFFVLYPHRDGLHLRPVIETVDDAEAFLTEHPLDIIAEGKAQRTPIMVGALSDEGLFTSIGMYKQEHFWEAFHANWTANVLRQFGVADTSKNQDKIAKKLKEFYLPNYDTSTRDEKFNSYTKMFTDSAFTLGMHQVISKQREFSPVYPYYYSRRNGPTMTDFVGELSEQRHPLVEIPFLIAKFLFNHLIGNKPTYYGNGHADEILMLFGVYGLSISNNEQDYLFSKQLVKLWVDFATNENTTKFGDLKLEPAAPSGPFKYLDISPSPSYVVPEFVERIKFLDSIGLTRPKNL